MNRKFRFGIVGAGAITPLHVKAVQQQPDAELVAICDIQMDRATQFAETYGIPYVYDQYEAMLEHEDLDIVCICTPNALHSDAVIAAAQAGKHIFCEKPLDVSVEKIDAMIDACRKHRVKLATVYQRRMMPEAIAARKWIREGKLGPMVLGGAYLKYHRDEAYYKVSGWRADRELNGGGALMTQGVHGIDLLQWMMGDVVSVFAYAAPLFHNIQVEDTAVVALKYKNGAFGVIEGATSVYPDQESRFELHGARGTIVFTDSGIKQWEVVDEHGNREESPVPDASNEAFDEAHATLIADLIDAIRNDREPLINGEEARKAIQIINAIYTSAQSGKEIALDKPDARD